MRARILRANAELVNALGTIQDMATHDSLTGLHNRASLTDALEHAVSKARRNDEGLAIYFIDLDGFKSVNDSLGHATGDQLLREIAQRLRARVRQSDLVARLGGDEFVVMVESVSDRIGLQLLASKLLTAIAEPMQLQGHEVTVTASIGIAVFPDDGSRCVDRCSPMPTSRCIAPRHSATTASPSIRPTSARASSNVSKSRRGCAKACATTSSTSTISRRSPSAPGSCWASKR